MCASAGYSYSTAAAAAQPPPGEAPAKDEDDERDDDEDEEAAATSEDAPPATPRGGSDGPTARGACCAASARLKLQAGQHTCTAVTRRKPGGHATANAEVEEEEEDELEGCVPASEPAPDASPRPVSVAEYAHKPLLGTRLAAVSEPAAEPPACESPTPGGATASGTKTSTIRSERPSAATCSCASDTSSHAPNMSYCFCTKYSRGAPSPWPRPGRSR